MTSPPPKFPPGYLEADISYKVVGTTVSFIILEALATALRVCSRRIHKTGFMWSDVLMPISLLFNLGVCTCAFLGIRWGAGRHAAAVPPEDLAPFIILNYYGTAPVYLCSVTFPKLAILDLYLHIFIDKFSRYATYFLGLIITSSLVANLCATLAQCFPIHQLWRPAPGGRCHDIHAHFTWVSFPNIFTDLVMLALPIPMILKLQASWRVKLGVLITFIVGSLGLVTSILRFIEFYEFGWNNGFSDPTWVDSIILTWTVVEPGVYHLTACFVTFRPLFRWIVVQSPLSSVLSRSHLLSGSTRSGHDTPETTKRLPSEMHRRSMSDKSDQNKLVPGQNGFSEFSIAADDEQEYSLADLESNIRVQHSFGVSRLDTINS